MCKVVQFKAAKYFFSILLLLLFGIFDWELLYSTEIPLSTFPIRLAAVK